MKLWCGIGTTEAYNQNYYMHCCKRCTALPHPAAKAACYAASMATAAGMPR